MSKFQCSQETQEKINAFAEAESQYKTAWEQFEQTHSAELEDLDKLREERNSKLDTARRAIREEAAEADITQTKSIKIEPFSVLKKWSSFYSPEKFVHRLRELNLFDSAKAAKIVVEKVDIAKFDTVQQFLNIEGKLKDFEDCEDGIELTPAVSGPKPVPAFGAEQKES